MEENNNINQDSGVSCLVMIAAYYGIPVNEESIKYTYNLYDTKANSHDILRIINVNAADFSAAFRL